MRHANSCRRTKGGTGPNGEVGITGRLQHQLGHSPEPDEVFEEMQRDKGYSGKHRRRSVTGSSKRSSVEENIVSGTNNGQSPRDRTNLDEPHREEEENIVEDFPILVECAQHVPEPEPTQLDPVEDSIDAPSLDTPLGRMIAKQVHELWTSPLGNTDEVKSLIDTLLLQVEWLKRRQPNTGIGDGDVAGGEAHDVTERVENLGTTSTPAVQP